MGTEQRPISELIRTEAHSYDVISGIADKNKPAVVHQRQNRDIIKADWCSVESGFSDTSLGVNSGFLFISPIFPWNVLVL